MAFITPFKNIQVRFFVLLCTFICYSTNNTFAQDTEIALAQQFQKFGEYDKAIAIYNPLFNKGQEIVYEDYLICLLNTKAYKAAHKLVKKMIKRYPTSVAYAIDEGRIYNTEGKSEEANKIFEKQLKNVHENEIEIAFLAQIFIKIEAYNFAIKTFLNGRELLGDNQAFSRELIRLYRLQKNMQSIIEESTNIVLTNPTQIGQTQQLLSEILKENSDYELLKTNIFKTIQLHPNSISLAELLIWTFLQEQEFNQALIQVIALDQRLNERGRRIYEIANLFLSNKAYEETIKAYRYLIDKGNNNNPYYIEAKTGILNVRNQKIEEGKATKEDLIELEKDYEQLLNEYGKNRNTLFAIRKLAELKAYKLDKSDEAKQLLNEAIAMNGINQSVIDEIKLDLGDLYTLNDERWEATLLYGQVEKSQKDNLLGQDAMFRNAQLAFFNGDFDWTQSQLNVLKGGTSQLISNDAIDLSALIAENVTLDTNKRALQLYAKARLNIFKTRYQTASNYLDTLSKEFPNHNLSDEVLMSKATIAIALRQWQQATQTLQTIIDNFYYEALADDALFMLANIEETRLNMPQKAKEHYEKLIMDFPASVRIIEARKRFRFLRGDTEPNP